MSPSISAIPAKLPSRASALARFLLLAGFAALAFLGLITVFGGFARADDYTLSMSPWRYISNGSDGTFETVQVASGTIPLIVHMGNPSQEIRILQRPLSTSGAYSMSASLDTSSLGDAVLSMNPAPWSPWIWSNSFKGTLSLDVTMNIERTSSPSGVQSKNAHWQLQAGGYAQVPFKDRRVVELWVKASNGTWYLRDWVSLTLDFGSVYVLRDPSNSNYWYGDLTNLGKTIHLYEYGGSMGPWSDGSATSNSSNPRPGGINTSPQSSCPTCEEDPYYYDAFNHSSYSHPYEQCQIGNVTASNASLHVTIGMGQAGFGRIGGSLSLYSLKPSATLLDPGALSLDIVEGHETVRAADSGEVLQYVSAATIAHVASDDSDHGYTLEFYHRDRDTPREGDAGPFATSGEPFATVRFECPDGALVPGEPIQSLRVTRSLGGTDQIAEYRYDASAESWALVQQEDGRSETVRTSQSEDLQAYTKERTLKDSSGVKQGHVIEEFRRFPFGERKVREIIDPEGEALTTTWEYNTNPEEPGAFGRVRQVVRSGNWRRYEYDRLGRPTKVVSQYLDAPIGAAENQCRVQETRYYVPKSKEGPTTPLRVHIEHLLGQEISRTYVVFRDGALYEIEAHIPGASWDAAENTATQKRYYTGGPFRGELKTVIRSNGTATLYQYELDGETLLDSTQLTETVISGEIDEEATNARRVRDNEEDDFPTIKNGTRSQSLVNTGGSTIARQSEDLRTGTERSSWVATRIDAFGRVEERTYSGGTTETTSYGCCHIEATKDRQGVTTSYTKTRNSSMRSRLGITDGVQTVGREKRVFRVGTDGVEAPVGTKFYDLAGRIVKETDAMGRVTAKTYATNKHGRQVITTTNPDGGIRIEETYPDGKIERVTGTAVYPVRYEYGIASPGDGLPPQRFRRRIALKRDGTDSGEWTQIFTDARGRGWRTLSSYKEDQPAVTSTYYDKQGRITRQVGADDVTNLYAYYKEANGEERHVRALDINRNGVIDYNGGDRITETITEWVELTAEERERRKTTGASGKTPNLVQRTSTKVWTENGDPSAIRIVSVTESSAAGEQLWQSANGREASSFSEETGPGSQVRTSIGPDGSRTIVYYEDHQESRSEIYHADGELLRSTVTEYDAYRRVVSRTVTDGENTIIASESRAFDALGRPARSVDHKGRELTYTYNPDNTIASVTLTSGERVLTTRYQYDAMGRRSVVERPDGKQVHYTYWPTGEAKSVSGAGVYPATYAFDHVGRQHVLTTGAGDTRWEYDRAGKLHRKVALGGKAVEYQYSPGGKLLQRTSARGVITNYLYNNGGELERVDYSDDNTASIVYGYNRLGQNTSVMHGDFTYLNSYNADGVLIRQLISGGPLHGVVLEQDFDETGLRTEFTANLPHQQSVRQHYGYDDHRRMNTVRQDEREARYTFDKKSGTLTKTQFLTGGKPIAETTRVFDDLGRLTTITTRSLKEGGDFYQSFIYGFNDANQRTRVEMADGSFWEYRYDDLGQVISAKKHWRDGTPVAGQQFEYTFDSIGNRESARYGGDTDGKNLSELAYTKGKDDPTQIGAIEHPGIAYVTGEANENAEVAVNGRSSERQGKYFSTPIQFNNTSGASVETIAIKGTESDKSDSATRRTHIPARHTQLAYDPDGNILFDGRWHYEWNGENRLIRMRSARVRGGRNLEINFTYDHVGRRITKRVVETIDGKRQAATDLRFVYDGWNLIAELDSSGRAVRTHLWGLDLSGTQQGAGGVGGLLSTATPERAVFVSYDGNGNINGELDAATSHTTHQSSFDAFGNQMSGNHGSLTPFAFSAKYIDEETGLFYYGFRYYDPVTGRWLSKDPMEESGGLNLYNALRNDCINRYDVLGLASNSPNRYHYNISFWEEDISFDDHAAKFTWWIELGCDDSGKVYVNAIPGAVNVATPDSIGGGYGKMTAGADTKQYALGEGQRDFQIYVHFFAIASTESFWTLWGSIGGLAAGATVGAIAGVAGSSVTLFTMSIPAAVVGGIAGAGAGTGLGALAGQIVDASMVDISVEWTETVRFTCCPKEGDNGETEWDLYHTFVESESFAQEGDDEFYRVRNPGHTDGWNEQYKK